MKQPPLNPDEPVLHPYRNCLRWLLAGLCVLGLGVYFYHNRLELRLFLSLSIRDAAILTVLFSASLWLYAQTFYQAMSKCVAGRVSFVLFFKTIVTGKMLGLIIPQAGAVYRGILFKQICGVPYTRFISGTFAFAWIDALLNIAIAAAVLAAGDTSMRIAGMPVMLWLAALTVGWFVPFGIRAMLRSPFCAGRFQSLRLRLVEMLDISVSCLRDKGVMIRLAAAHLANFGVCIAIFYILLRSFGAAASLEVLTLFSVLMKIASYIILTPGNVGVREIAYGYLAAQLHLPPAQGIAVSVFYRLFGTLVLALLGIGLVIKHQLKLKRDPLI